MRESDRWFVWSYADSVMAPGSLSEESKQRKWRKSEPKITKRLAPTKSKAGQHTHDNGNHERRKTTTGMCTIDHVHERG